MIFDWVFGTSTTVRLKKIKPIIDKINQLEGSFRDKDSSEFQDMMSNWKARYNNKENSLDDLIPEVFAAIREASRRTLGLRHFDVQLIGGYFIHKGMIAEMGTGEGKTLVATLPAILNAITGKSVFIITVNDYLAKRDFEFSKPLYNVFGLTSSFIKTGCDMNKKKSLYISDICHITNSEIGFDYLRDNMVTAMNQKAQRGFYFAIIDEADQVLINDATVPLIMSGQDNEQTNLYEIINPIIASLTEDMYQIEHKSKNVILKESGLNVVEDFLIKKQLINLINLETRETDLFTDNINVYHVVSNLTKAHFGMHNNRDYVVLKDEVIIIDEHTGRLSFGRNFSNGLQQALQAKEGVQVKPNTKSVAFISPTNLYRLFEKLGGMTGTGMSDAAEFDEIYNLDVVTIPSNKPNIRKSDHNIRLYQERIEMYKDIIEIVGEKYAKQQPLLLCTPSVDTSEMLSDLLKEKNLPHNVLNAKNHEQEAYIVAQAGRPGTITVATNMAGRGTDIYLGGSVDMKIDELLKQNPEEDIDQLKKYVSEQFLKDRKIVMKAGGLCVIIAGALDAEKTAIQFIGRSARQGDPGESYLFASLEDELLLPLFNDAVNRQFISFCFNKRCNVSKRVQEMIEQVQATYQNHFFEIRKNTLKYDNVVNDQRINAYNFRDFIMSDQNPKMFIHTIIKIFIEDIRKIISTQKLIDQDLSKYLQKTLDIQEDIYNLNDLKLFINNKLEEFCASFSDTENIFNTNNNLSNKILAIFDEQWYDLITEMDNLKKTIYLVSYGQKDPVFEFRRVAFDFFRDAMQEFRFNLVKNIIKGNNMNMFNLQDQMLDSLNNIACFCGSQKPFSECHGKNITLSNDDLDCNDISCNLDNEEDDNKDTDNMDINLQSMQEILQNFMKEMQNHQSDHINNEDQTEKNNSVEEEDSLESDNEDMSINNSFSDFNNKLNNNHDNVDNNTDDDVNDDINENTSNKKQK